MPLPPLEPDPQCRPRHDAVEAAGAAEATTDEATGAGATTAVPLAMAAVDTLLADGAGAGS
jgi:hypothetical protein